MNMKDVDSYQFSLLTNRITAHAACYSLTTWCLERDPNRGPTQWNYSGSIAVKHYKTYWKAMSLNPQHHQAATWFLSKSFNYQLLGYLQPQIRKTWGNMGKYSLKQKTWNILGSYSMHWNKSRSKCKKQYNFFPPYGHNVFCSAVVNVNCVICDVITYVL